ncbi:MAG: O-antigen ligase family protein [Nitrospirota bacterium]
MPARAFCRDHSSLLVVGGLTLFAPLIDGGTTHFPVLVIRLVLLGVLTAWFVGSRKSGRLSLRWSRLYPIILAFVGWSLLSVVSSPYTAVGLQWLLSIASYGLMLVLVVQRVDSPGQLRWLVMVCLGMGVFEATVGIYQFWGLSQPRATGTFFNPNFYATYEVAMFALAFGLLHYSQRKDRMRGETPLLWLTAGATALAVVLAQSRGALLAFIVAVGFVGFCRYGKVFLGVLVLCLFVGWVIPNPLQQRILSVGTQDPYAYTRQDIWKNSLQRIIDHPWGVGLGLYKYTSFQYRFPVEGAIARYGKRAESAHNEYLQMAVELGLPGLALLLMGIGFLGREIRETLNGEIEGWERSVVIGLTGGCLGILVHGAVDSVFHEPALVLLMLLFAGMILVLKRLTVPGSASVRVVSFPYHPARMALVGMLVTLLALLIIRPAAAWYTFDRGEAEMRVGQEARALDWYQWATRIDPGTTAYRDAVARVEVSLYQQSGNLPRLLGAVEELRVALDLNPLDGRYAHRLGKLYVLLADHADSGAKRETLLGKAAAYYEQAMQLDPYSPFNYLELGQLRLAQERGEQAKSWLRLAISYEPNFLPARILLAEVAVKEGQKDVAFLEYTEILKIKERYQGRVLNTLERQYLDVDHEPLKRSLGLATSS